MSPILAFAATLTPDEDGRLVVHFPDLPEALTDGADEAEALREASDALSEALLQRLARGEGIPRPRRPRKGEYQVAPYPNVALKMMLSHVSTTVEHPAATLARNLDVDHKEARRLLDPAQPSKADRLSDALAALGYLTTTRLYRVADHGRVEEETDWFGSVAARPARRGDQRA